LRPAAAIPDLVAHVGTTLHDSFVMVSGRAALRTSPDDLLDCGVLQHT
jgi:hypothetical protein